ncbi:vesicle-fusing ATPase, adenosinetriphosphatase [Pseudoloma neurophilia]|uniref:Vesicle-fusing ATPase, adenosinetriphosphatase n=1 Tax=Pseudoloma neurophilia TaxID=146866 RepID=A0A0R0M2N7_9MICR|nr:vesicle-fusing ATPase, adenosinetriphosphatase [Pseudoloma neurophilia]
MSVPSQKNVRTRITEMYMKEHLKNVNKIEEKHPKFSDLSYLTYLKQDVEKYILNPLLRSDVFQNYNIMPFKTVLLNGIKSVGKRFFLKSICLEYQLNFLDVFLEDEKGLKDCFRKCLDMEPCLIYLNGNFDEKEKLVYEMIRCIEKIENHKILVILGCKSKNLPENILKLTSHMINMRIPNENDRFEILESFKMNNIKNINLKEIAKLTPGFLPKELHELCVSAISESVFQKRDLQQIDFLIHLQSQRKISLDDIGALEKVKEEIRMNVVLPLEYPEKFRRMGIERTSGILLYGPPGCGKTMLAKAISNMLYCNFISISGPELINKYVGDTEKELREIFNRAKNQEPCVLFFDEIDSLCSKRGNNEFQTRVVNQILTLMDGIDEKGKVFIIGATNRIHALDKAVIRPGRFDKVLEVPLPSKNERIDILLKCIRNIPTDNIPCEKFDLDGFSGADIAGMVREAAMIALKENFHEDNIILREHHFIQAIKNMKTRSESISQFELIS